jgi:DNA-directed RNA polymerase sigma subunit (sigma70/sigma32)
VPPGQVVNAVPPSRRKARLTRRPKPVGPPRIVETLRKAIEWRRQLDAGEVPNQAAIARREGITRARVTQVLALLRLPPEILTRITDAHDGVAATRFSEHGLRRIIRAVTW